MEFQNRYKNWKQLLFINYSSKPTFLVQSHFSSTKTTEHSDYKKFLINFSTRRYKRINLLKLDPLSLPNKRFLKLQQLYGVFYLHKKRLQTVWNISYFFALVSRHITSKKNENLGNIFSKMSGVSNTKPVCMQ